MTKTLLAPSNRICLQNRPGPVRMPYDGFMAKLFIRNLRTCVALAFVFLCDLHFLSAQSTEPSYALRGTLVNHAGIVEEGTVLIPPIGGIPHLAKNERDARISCTRPQPCSVCGFL